MIEKLDRHYIVCGFGRVGRSAAEELKSEGAKFLIVDRDENRIERAMHLGYLAVATDCTRDESLRELGLPRASGLIAALGSDADNLYLTLTAKTLVPELRIATRVNEDDSEPKLRRAGADVVFAPYKMTGQRLTQSLVRPHVNDFIDLTTGNNTLGLDVRIEQLRVSEECEYVSKSLRQAQLRSELGVIVLAIRRARGEMLFNPPPDAEMSAGDFLIAMGPPARLQLLEAVLAEKKP